LDVGELEEEPGATAKSSLTTALT